MIFLLKLLLLLFHNISRASLAHHQWQSVLTGCIILIRAIMRLDRVAKVHKLDFFGYLVGPLNVLWDALLRLSSRNLRRGYPILNKTGLLEATLAVLTCDTLRSI